MARDIERLERYVENVPYGEDSLPCEIHGPESEEVIKTAVKNFADIHSIATKAGDNETAAKAEKGIRHIDKVVANSEVIKQDWVANLRSASNYGDLYLVDKIMTEEGVVSIGEEGELYHNVLDDRTGQIASLTTEAISAEFFEKGDWMQKLMEAKQRLINARNDRGNPPPFDIPYFANNILYRYWRSILADSDPGLDPNGPSNGYRLQLVLQDAIDENGNLPPDYNLTKESFNPKNDTRLFKSLNDELHRAFYGPDYMSDSEKTEALNITTLNSDIEKENRYDALKYGIS